MTVTLGPNPDFGKPLDRLPPPKPKSEHKPRPGLPPRPLPTDVMRRLFRNGGAR
jgi:hypothetical protein